MIDSTDIYKSSNIDIRTVMENPKMLKFVPDHLKTKKICHHAVKKLPNLLTLIRLDFFRVVFSGRGGVGNLTPLHISRITNLISV